MPLSEGERRVCADIAAQQDRLVALAGDLIGFDTTARSPGDPPRDESALQAYLGEHKGVGIKRTRIDEILIAEGLRWRKQETWFGHKADPDFAAKRGRSRRSTRTRPTARPSSASTRWGRSRPRASRAKR